MKPSPRLISLLINLWPPFLGAGIRVRHIRPDWREIVVSMRLGLTNRNYVGVHFGGSLYAMTDPFFMLMLMHTLGSDYYVWDKAGRIEYIKPGRGVVSARFTLEEAALESIRAHTAGGDKYFPELQVDVVDASGEVVARVHKTLYVKRKKPR
ncbi:MULTISPECIES: DUF4442 domain-containing protein [Gulbenkiania]|uniref:Acyl-coenzyme A thioesterase PaaI, contains HGG motif n=2 Tax=Gulbenkiania TaxID=397456 RepID=A0A0K6H2H6_9NEIS|nr:MULTISPECIES: DUF4442 domain-containing protein [Gulbenkiania]TCW33605.1 acyl-coenzyme A thioesterase PaaI-like protein [Gulbenkiania mobilis]CUA85075.1 Acyl-coenzyme A thioesterase PaaI, contains HGG motif [Gulbenkiania indica]